MAPDTVNRFKFSKTTYQNVPHHIGRFAAFGQIIK
jgi:hypothetical protein